MGAGAGGTTSRGGRRTTSNRGGNARGGRRTTSNRGRSGSRRTR